MAKLTKTFITEFKKQVLSAPMEINNWSGDVDNCRINDDIIFNGFIEKDGVLVLICTLGRKSLQKPSIYINGISNSELFSSDALLSTSKTYWLIYKNKSSYLVFEYDYQTADKDEISFKPNFQLSQFATTFSDANTVNESRGIRSDVENIIQSLWNSMGCGSNNRTLFIILTWILLRNEDIEFTTLKNGKKYSLSQYLDFLWEHSLKFRTNEEEWEKEKKWFEHVDGWTLVEAFNRIITRKIKHDGENSEAVKKQIEKFKELISSVQNKKTKEFAILLASQLYNDVYKKYGKDIDMNKLAFELENKWNNRTSGNQVAAKGQIYTHTMMKNLIMKLIKENVKNDSTCYDPTCGTGGFCESFYKLCEKDGELRNVTAYGNEIDNDCSNLAWINGLSSDIDVRVFNYDCFDPEIKDELITPNSIDFLLMNPPFGMNKGKFLGMPYGFHWEEDMDQKRSIKPTEWTFCRYNLESFVKQCGWFAFVIPVSCVSENKQNNYDKERMIEECEIWFVIKIREDIFTPQAGKACCLIIGRYLNGWRSKKEIETWKTKCIDFTQDGGEIKRKKGEVEYNQKEIEKLWMERILDNKCLDGICQKAGGEDEVLNSILYETNEDGSIWYEEKVLKSTDNWIFTKREKINVNDQKLSFYTSTENRRHALFMNKMNKIDVNKCALLDNPNFEWREVRIDELFELVNGVKTFDQNLSKGPYPYISASSSNNGITGYVNEFSYDTNENCVITVAGFGSSGSCFVQKGKFAIRGHGSIMILSLKIQYKYLTENDLVKIAFLMTQKFGNIYSYNNSLNNSRLMNETVILPFDKRNDEIVDLNKIYCIHVNDKFSRFDEMMMKMNEELNVL